MEYIRTNPTAAKYNVDRLYISGACDSIIEDFVTGQTGAGLLKMLLVFAVYVVAAIVASIIFFRKKELDF